MSRREERNPEEKEVGKKDGMGGGRVERDESFHDNLEPDQPWELLLGRPTNRQLRSISTAEPQNLNSTSIEL